MRILTGAKPIRHTTDMWDTAMEYPNVGPAAVTYARFYFGGITNLTKF